MVAYGFKKRFVAPIRAGLGLIGLGYDDAGNEIPAEFVIDDDVKIARPFDPMRDLNPPINPKRQTIRAIGKRRHAQPGETLQLYTAMRTKQCEKIGEARCVSVQSIEMINIPGDCRISIDGSLVWYYNFLNDFAKLDGFSLWADMREFWRIEHDGARDFVGVLIKWEPL